MVLLGNIIWFILFGWWSFLLYAVLGGICYITIIGIPIGKALFQYAKLMALPYGKVIIAETELKGKENVAAVRQVGGVIANIIWLPVGVLTFILNIGVMIAAAITIIGIPFAVVVARSCKFLLWPVGAKVITKEQYETLKMERTMMKVMGTAMAVNNMASNQPQAVQMKQLPAAGTEPSQMAVSQSPQSNQTLDNLKASGVQVVEGIKKTGGKAMSAITETGSAGMSFLKDRQMAIQERDLAQEKDMTVDELLKQIETKLYHNKLMAWMLPFLEYITLAVGVICAMIAMIRFGIARGFFYGVIMAAPIMIIAVVFGIIKRNHLLVFIVLGLQILSHIVLGCMGMGFGFLWILCCIAVISGYTYAFFIEKGTGQQRIVSAARVSSTSRRFCSQCGEEVFDGMDFCAQCGTKI